MNEPSPTHADHRLSLAILIVLAATTVIGLGAILGVGDMGQRIAEYWTELQTMPPLVYFTTMALLCILPIPISPFYVAAGPLFGFSTALLWIAPSIAVNQLLAHRLTDGVLRPSFEALLSGRGYLIPKPRSKGEENLLTALIRVTPGVPYAIQNWILGLAGVERFRYLAISWPIQMLHATAWVLLGQSAFEGRMGIASLAIGLIIAFALIARWVGGRLRASRHAAADDGPSEIPAHARVRTMRKANE